MDKATGQFVPKIKLSENAEKITNPGNKTIQRIYDKATGKIIADLICLVGEEFDTRNSLLLFDPLETWKKTMLAPDSYTMRELMIPIFLDGRCVYQSPKVMDIQVSVKKSWIPCGMSPSVSSTPTQSMWTCPMSCGTQRTSCWIPSTENKQT